MHSFQRWGGGGLEVETLPVDSAQDLKDIGGKVKKQNRLEAIRPRSLLCLKVGHGLANHLNIDDVRKMFHDEGGVGRVMFVMAVSYTHLTLPTILRV